MFNYYFGFYSEYEKILILYLKKESSQRERESSQSCTVNPFCVNPVRPRNVPIFVTTSGCYPRASVLRSSSINSLHENRFVSMS